MSVPDDEEALVRRSCRGDRAAFEALVRGTSRWVYARLYLESGDTHRAEDLTQETYLTAWRRIGELNDPAAFRGWLMAIARRTLLDGVKHGSRKKRFGPRLTLADAETVATSNDSPPEQAALAEERQQALSMLRALPEKYREPLALRYLGGADYETISRQLGLTNGSLRGLLQRGLKLLRERLDKPD